MAGTEKDWKGLKSIALERKSIEKNGRKTIEYRYFISSLKGDIETLSRAVRGHWSIESMYWHLDVTFREDANATLDKISAQNLNIIWKWSLSILKMMELTKRKLSMKKKRFVISLSPIKYLEEVLGFKKSSCRNLKSRNIHAFVVLFWSVDFSMKLDII